MQALILRFGKRRRVALTEGPAQGFRRRWQGHSLLFTGLSAAAYAVSYAFYAVLARNLAITEFGLAGVYIAVLGLGSLVSGALILAVAREVSAKGSVESAAAVRAGAIRPLRRLSLACVIAGVALLPFAVEPALILLAAALVPLRDLHCGLLNGLRMNAQFGFVILTEASVRLVGAFATIWFPSAQVALVAWLLSYAAGLGLAIALLPRAARAPSAPLTFGAGLRESLLVRLPLVSFLNVDVILIPVVLGLRAEVGIYVAAAILSRVPFYLVTAHAIGELPNLVREQGAGAAAGRVALVGAVGAGAMIAVIWAAPRWVLGVAFGGSYATGDQILLILSFTGFLLVQVNSVVYTLISAGRGVQAAGVLGAGALAEVFLILALGSAGGSAGVATITAIAAGGSLLALILLRVVSMRIKKSPIWASTAREG